MGPIQISLVIISDPFFSKTALRIFLKFCMMLDIDKLRKVTKPDYPKKILDHPKSTKMWSKWQFFYFFSKTALTILMKLGQNVELINSEHLAKTACPKNCRSRDIHPQSSDFGQKRQKWCLKNTLYLENRKCYWKSDLIFGIYDKFSFPHNASDFFLLIVFREKNRLKDDQF